MTIDITWPATEGANGLEGAIERLCREATDAVLADMNILILSDRATGPDRVPIPAALATAAVHHHLIRQGLRMQADADPRKGRSARSAPFLRAHRSCKPRP